MAEKKDTKPTTTKKDDKKTNKKDEDLPPALDQEDIDIMKNYGLGPYAGNIKQIEKDIKDIQKKVDDLSGIKESDTGLAPPSRWDLVADKSMLQEEQPLQVQFLILDIKVIAIMYPNLLHPPLQFNKNCLYFIIKILLFYYLLVFLCYKNITVLYIT